MASPQTEEGYTRIANEILEQLPRYKFNATQLDIILVVWRFTYGFQRKEHDLAVSFVAEATGIHPVHVKREIKNLIDAEVLTVTKPCTKRGPRWFAFNKNYESWRIEKRSCFFDQN